jgi:hypothetical protein
MMGGEYGWPYAYWLGRLRGWLDGIGSPGKHKSLATHVLFSDQATDENRNFSVGDNLDFYRLEALSPDCLLLHSELNAPGEGWMEWSLSMDTGTPKPQTELSQTGYFAPRGTLGFIYWVMLYPIHSLVLRGLLYAIKRKAERGLKS